MVQLSITRCTYLRKETCNKFMNMSNNLFICIDVASCFKLNTVNDARQTPTWFENIYFRPTLTFIFSIHYIANYTAKSSTECNQKGVMSIYASVKIRNNSCAGKNENTRHLEGDLRAFN